MGENSNVEWTDHTFSAWWGCQAVSPECANCYAEAFSERVGHGRGKRLPLIWGGPSTPRRFLGDDTWKKPLAWNRAAAAAGERHRVFSASMSDVFEDRTDLVAPRARLLRLIEQTPHLDWLLLTKRVGNVLPMTVFGGWSEGQWPPNVWLGTTVGTVARLPQIEQLLRVKGPRVRFISYEPALELLDFKQSSLVDGKMWPWLDPGLARDIDPGMAAASPVIDWIICGGESGPGHRDMDLACVRQTVEDCVDSGTAVFVKQDSGPFPGLKGRIPDELWRFKQFPSV